MPLPQGFVGVSHQKLLPTGWFFKSPVSLFVKTFVAVWWSIIKFSPGFIFPFAALRLWWPNQGGSWSFSTALLWGTYFFLNVQESVCQSVYLIINTPLQQYAWVCILQICFCSLPVLPHCQRVLIFFISFTYINDKAGENSNVVKSSNYDERFIVKK